MKKRNLKILLYKIKIYLVEDLRYDLSFFLQHFNLISHIRFLYNRIKNLFYFFPIIWTDYWFDSVFLHRIVKHKLEQMEVNFRTIGMTDSASDSAKEIKEVIEDLNVLTLNMIEEEEFNLFYQKFPNRMPKGKKLIKWFNRQRLHNEEEDNYFKEMMIRINTRTDNLLLKIYTTIAKRSTYWWD
jgi:hypothetical protein